MTAKTKTLFVLISNTLLYSILLSMSMPIQKLRAADPNQIPFNAFAVHAKKATLDNLNVRLFAENENLVLRFPNGTSTVFTPAHEQFAQRLLNNKTHVNEAMGTIETQGVKRIWRYTHDVEIEFLGSYPVAVSNREHQLNLGYENRELVSAKVTSESTRYSPEIRDALIERIQAHFLEAEQSACPDKSNSQESIEQESDPLEIDPLESNEQVNNEQENNQQCNDVDAPLPVGFNNPLNTNEIHINTRPADCQSYFIAFPSIERGTQIEQALANYPPYLGSNSGAHSFPVADYWNNGNVYVLISRDLTANSYDPILNPDGLYEQLIADGENIETDLINVLLTDGRISHTTHDQTTTLHESEAQVVYLDVVVQFGVITDAQRAQFDAAAEELLSQYGIVLRLIMIP